MIFNTGHTAIKSDKAIKLIKSLLYFESDLLNTYIVYSNSILVILCECVILYL